jgi:diadenosine tetraphosphate (Ap4A) HIT family hydrolase
VGSYFDATDDEQQGIRQAIETTRRALDRNYHPDGYNIGVNVGVAAGQTVMHLHVHLIPRYHGNVEDPRGGVRHCIPGKGYYTPPLR